MESSPSKKSPLLYRFFLKGYKNPNSAQNKPSCKIVSYIDKNNREKEEERYKRRQREPEAPDSDNLIAPPSPFNSTFTGPLVFSSQILEEEAPKLASAPDSIEDSPILNVTWKSDPPEKIKRSPSPNPNYFQSSILNQRSQTEDSEEKRRAVSAAQSIRKFTETEAFYANHELIRTVVPPPTHTFSLPPFSPIAEPIYAEISSANKKKTQNKSQHQPPEPIQFEPVYENLDVIRLEMANRQPSPPSSPPKEGSFLSSSIPESHQPASLSTLKGEIDEESIIENKPAIKNYWETKMRENAASQFARSNFGVPPTTIIDKINEEIREDYMRNLELLQDEGLPRSSASDMSDEVIDFDSFDLASSNGSSPFGKPLQTSSPLMMPESPTLIDSGHQSQESHHPASESDLLDSPHNLSIDTRETSVSPQPSEPVNVHANRRSASPTPVPPPKQLLNGYGYRAPFEKQRLKSTGKIENHVTHYLQFNKLFSKTVKPLDEITPAPERIHPRPFKAAVYTPAPATVIAPPPPPPVTSEEEKPVVKAVQVPEPPPASLKPSAKGDDISYMMATSRLKKEIEDNLRREQELKEEGRVLTLSVETVASPPETRRIQRLSSNDQVVTIPADTKEPIHFNMEIPPPHQTQDSMAIETKIKIKRSASSPAKKPPAQPLQNVPAQATQEEPPVSEHTWSQQAAQTKTYAQINQRNAPPQSLSFKLGKNFTSLERYIMYSSLTKLNYRSMPPVWNKSASQEILNEDHVEVKEDEDRDEPEKPRKYYVPAERKIKEELEEMVEREAELKKSRGQWKSTPNLSALDEEEPEHKEEVEMRQPVGKRNTEKRRRSALISKWEDMISKYNQ